MKFIEKPYRKNKLYTGKALDFFVDTVLLPDGNKAKREFTHHPNAVAVVPFVDENNIVLVRQYRYPVRKITYEIPAGKLDRKEGLTDCVRRELAEETGFAAGSVKRFISYWPTPAFSTEVVHIYIARDLTPVETKPDKDEFIDRIIIPFDTAVEWVRSGKIMDSKTIISLLYIKLTGVISPFSQCLPQLSFQKGRCCPCSPTRLRQQRG
ncbi:MAG: NUDIX hydrolase [Elusimicrobiota bacterium]